jgi:hypothetical protein
VLTPLPVTATRGGAPARDVAEPMISTSGGRSGPPLGRAERRSVGASPRHVAPEATLAHRNRLRRFEFVAGHVSIDVTTELVSIGPGASSAGVVFVREGGQVHLADPASTAVDRREPLSPGATTEDVRDVIHGSRVRILLRNRVTAAEAWVDTSARVDAMRPYGSWQLRHFTVRWVATADFDVLARIRPHPCAGAWDVFTVLDTPGTRTFCSIGPHRDRRVDRTLALCHVPPGIRIDPVLSGSDPRLTLRIDSANERRSGCEPTNDAPGPIMGDGPPS